MFSFLLSHLLWFTSLPLFSPASHLSSQSCCKSTQCCDVVKMASVGFRVCVWFGVHWEAAEPGSVVRGPNNKHSPTL